MRRVTDVQLGRKDQIPYSILLLFALMFCLPVLVSTGHQAQGASSPDLTVDSIWLEENSAPGQPVQQVAPGDQFLIVASIKNIGTASASGYYLDVYYDSEYGRGGPDTIAPGETQIWYVGQLTAVTGSHTTKWVVDPDNQMVELDETNNLKELVFTIGSQTTTTSTTTSNSTSTATTQTTVTTTTSTTTTSSTSTTTTYSPVSVSITVAANPAGSIVVDGTTYTSSQAFAWVPGSSHTVAANSPVTAGQGIQYVWASWADGGDQSRTIATPSSAATYTANYQAQYQVTYSQTGCSMPVSLPASEWVNAGASSVGVFPSTVASSDGKTQCVLQSANDAGPTNAPTVRAGTYKTQWQVTFVANPSGAGAITVNGQPSGTAWYDDGAALNIQATGNTGYGFSSWNTDSTSITFDDPSSPSTTVTIHGSGTITAGFSTVQDKTPPTLNLPSAMTVEGTSSSGAVVTYSTSASDLVDGSVPVTCTPASGSTFPFATTTVSCSATDKSGNSATGAFTVTVQDKTPPTISVPADMTVPATSNGGAVAKFTVSASDLVDGSVAVTCTPASGSTFPLGTTAVSCSAKDKAGNAASASFKVTVSGGVTVTLLNSSGNGLSGAVVQYYKGGWKSFGTTGSDGTARMALAAGTYTFQITYAGASQQKSQNVGTNPNVVFQTTLVTVKLLSSTNTELNGVAQYYAGGWKTFGTGTTTTSMELLPLTYTFQVSYAGASQQVSQNVRTNANVIFKTVQVHSDSGKCTSYYAGGWKTFTQNMELLPGTYAFRFSDRTKDTSYTLVVGAIKHVH